MVELAQHAHRVRISDFQVLPGEAYTIMMRGQRLATFEEISAVFRKADGTVDWGFAQPLYEKSHPNGVLISSEGLNVPRGTFVGVKVNDHDGGAADLITVELSALVRVSIAYIPSEGFVAQMNAADAEASRAIVEAHRA